ncbi:hypothetical protein HanRHA438_Chr04g0154751 [Helianthus annuus]|nr:hypothetical protein HanRHA438_Chr04g0154751 [Helianthus annuus]
MFNYQNSPNYTLTIKQAVKSSEGVESRSLLNQYCMLILCSFYHIKMNPSWWGTPAPDGGKYTNTSLSPSWAESPVSTSSQANAISTGQWAFVSNQTPSIQSILLSESETESLNRPPKLMHLNEYPGWVDRFRTYVLGQNTELWIRFTTDFDQAIEVAASSTATFADLPEDQKKTYDLEKKAYAILTQALRKDIYHQFVSFKTTKKLWDALKTRGVGNEATRQLRHDLLKKEFDGFTCMDKVSLGDMTSRFYHLLTELGNFGVVTTTAEVVKKFADALPPQWNSFLEILKYNGVLGTTNINNFVQLLENKDQEETLKAKEFPCHKILKCIMELRVLLLQNPLCHATLRCIMQLPVLRLQDLVHMLHFRRRLSLARICMAIIYKFLLSQLSPQTCMEIHFNHLLLNNKHVMEVHHLLVNNQSQI